VIVRGAALAVARRFRLIAFVQDQSDQNAGQQGQQPSRRNVDRRSVPCSQEEGQRIAEQCRSKRMFCAMRLRAGLGRHPRVGWGQPAARSRNDYLGINISGGACTTNSPTNAAVISTPVFEMKIMKMFIGSLFNSHLSTVTQGMLYCLAVGLLGGIVQRARRRNLIAESLPCSLTK
jgi:hypothetical protein